MKWSDLSMTDRAKIIALEVKKGITNLDDIKNNYNNFARGGYTKWKQKIKEHKNIDIDNDPTYDYEGFYNSNPSKAWDMLNKDSNAHFTDKYKTVYHPSFSDESIYSGYRNQFNPNGITGGTWIDDNNYIMSQSQFDNDWNTDATLDYFNSAEDSPVNLYAPDGATVLKGITVTPNKFGGGGKKNYRIARLNSNGKPVIDYSIPAFSSEQEMDSYMKNNNLQQTFVENLPELVVKHPDLVAKEREQEANWTDKDIERYTRMMESTGWKADTDFADKAIAAEQRARNVSQGAVLGQLASGLNVLSPSQQFGALSDMIQDKRGYWDSIGGGNSGFFTDNYTKKHPIISGIGNMIADGIIVNNINKGLNILNKNNIKEFNPTQTTARLRQDSGNFEVGQTIDLKQLLSEEGLNKVKNFMREDVAPRLKNAIADEGRFPDLHEDAIIDIKPDLFNNQIGKYPTDWVDDTPVIITEPDPNYGGFADFNEGVIKLPISSLQKTNKMPLDEIIVHELEHLQRNKLKDFGVDVNAMERGINYDKNNIQSGFITDINGINKDKLNPNNLTYTPEETNILDNAYRFSDDYLLKNNITPILEKGATNRELRYKLSELYNAVGENLNKIIDNLPGEDILNILDKLNGYGENFIDTFLQLPKERKYEIINNIKKSLKYVGATGLGIEALDETNSK